MASKNKKLGRITESKFVQWFADKFGLVPLIKDKYGSNMNEAEVARAEEVSQLLDNQGIDIWFSDATIQGRVKLSPQIKSRLCKGKKVKTVDVQPLLDMPEDTLNILITELKHRPGKTNMMKLADIVSMDLETFRIILNGYLQHEQDSEEDKTL